jgi:opacity protein-like surface antigen
VRWRHRWVIVLALTGFMVPSGSRAESGETDTGEFSAYTGLTMGGFGAHAAVGAGAGMAITRYGIALADMSYMPLGGDTLRRLPGRPVVGHSGLYDFNFSVHFRVPLRGKRKRWEPYGIVGTSLLLSTFRTTSLDNQGVLVSAGRSQTNFGFETGGGVRYYAERNWGVRTELRYTLSSRNFARLLAGVFYQFDGEWPFRLRHVGRSRPRANGSWQR